MTFLWWSISLNICHMQGSRVNHSDGLTHWDRVRHICVSKLTIIGSDNGLSPGRRQAIIWTNAGMLFIGSLGTNFNEILIEIHTFSFKKIHLKVLSGKWRPFSLGLNVLTHWGQDKMTIIFENDISNSLLYLKIDLLLFKLHQNLFQWV